MKIMVDKSIYSRQVLLKTAYSFSDRVYLHLSQNKSSWIISWTDMPDQDIRPEMFENEMISQQLREDIVEKTKDIRKLLLSRAFASSVIQMAPLNWEEKTELDVDSLDDCENQDEEDILKGWFDK